MQMPPPDISQTPTFVSEFALVETMYSDDKQIRVSITRDQCGIYRIHPERWEVMDFTVVGHAYWNQWGSSASFTDDIEIARGMARELLRTTPRSSVVPDNEV
jgi:hypothetical protein